MKKCPNFLPKFEIENLKFENLRFHCSPCQKLKEEARMTFTINEMLCHCLNNLKVYEVVCYAIIKVGCVTNKLASFSWKAVLVSPWWCHRKKADFTFAFTTTNRQERFLCWRPSSDKLKSLVSQHIFLF